MRKDGPDVFPLVSIPSVLVCLSKNLSRKAPLPNLIQFASAGSSSFPVSNICVPKSPRSIVFGADSLYSATPERIQGSDEEKDFVLFGSSDSFTGHLQGQTLC